NHNPARIPPPPTTGAPPPPAAPPPPRAGAPANSGERRPPGGAGGDGSRRAAPLLADAPPAAPPRRSPRTSPPPTPSPPAARDATSFPQAIGLASTWDPDLVREISSLIASEVRPRGVHLVLSPVVDVARDPRWGRIEETFGEDPFLVGELGVASVEGLQGL